MFINLLKKIVADQLETQVFVTNEEMDVSVTIANLMSMLQAAPEYRDAIIKQTFDLMGLPQPQLPQQPPQPPQMMPPQPMQGGGMPPPGAQAQGGMPQGAPQMPQTAGILHRGRLAPQMQQQVATNALTG